MGGGPAGSTTATRLAILGYEVTLYESEKFPREHIGESLLPATLILLEPLGVLPRIQAEGFTKKAGATMLWGSSTKLWSWYFKETNQRFTHSYQVERPRFDQLLLENAADCGVEVHEGVAVESIELEDERVVSAKVNGQEIDFDFFIDASGQSSILANKLKSKHYDEVLINLSAYGYFADAEHLEGEDAGNILIESFQDGWIWKIPLQNQISSVGVVADRDEAVAKIREVGVNQWFRDSVDRSVHIAEYLKDAPLTTELRVVKDWSYSASSFSGQNYYLVGDAACFIDPLFSTGVHLAVAGGYLASALINTWALNHSIYEESRTTYDTLYRSQYRHFQDLVHLFYGGNRTHDSYFWQSREISGSDRYSPRESFVRLVSGQSITGYERSVLNQGALPKEFADRVDSIEQKRSELQARLTNEELKVVSFLKPNDLVVKESVLFEGTKFGRGLVCERPSREALPISPLIAQALECIDGPTKYEELLNKLRAKFELTSELEKEILRTLRLLILDERLEIVS